MNKDNNHNQQEIKSYAKSASEKMLDGGKSEEERAGEYFAIVQQGLNDYLDRAKAIAGNVPRADIPILIVALEYLCARYKGMLPSEGKQFYESLAENVLGISPISTNNQQ